MGGGIGAARPTHRNALLIVAIMPPVLSPRLGCTGSITGVRRLRSQRPTVPLWPVQRPEQCTRVKADRLETSRYQRVEAPFARSVFRHEVRRLAEFRLPGSE